MGSAGLASKLRALASFSACDISDALLKLQVRRAGFLHDILPYAPHAPFSDALREQGKVIAPASTVLFVPKSQPNPPTSITATAFANTTEKPAPDASSALHPVFQGIAESNIPADTHWVDLSQPDTVVVLSQPDGQTCAVLGGIMALRMKKLGAKGVLVDGRIRDLTELRSLKLPIWGRATSTVGTGLSSRPWALNVPVTVGGVTVSPGDIMFCDPVEGAVVIPQDKLDEVIELLPKLTDADDNVKVDVSNGASVRESFAKHRGKL